MSSCVPTDQNASIKETARLNSTLQTTADRTVDPLPPRPDQNTHKELQSVLRTANLRVEGSLAGAKSAVTAPLSTLGKMSTSVTRWI